MGLKLAWYRMLFYELSADEVGVKWREWTRGGRFVAFRAKVED
jgi:hypothetical protein